MRSGAAARTESPVASRAQARGDGCPPSSADAWRLSVKGEAMTCKQRLPTWVRVIEAQGGAHRFRPDDLGRFSGLPWWAAGSPTRDVVSRRALVSRRECRPSNPGRPGTIGLSRDRGRERARTHARVGDRLSGPRDATDGADPTRRGRRTHVGAGGAMGGPARLLGQDRRRARRSGRLSLPHRCRSDVATPCPRRPSPRGGNSGAPA